MCLLEGQASLHREAHGDPAKLCLKDEHPIRTECPHQVCRPSYLNKESQAKQTAGFSSARQLTLSQQSLSVLCMAVGLHACLEALQSFIRVQYPCGPC